MHRFNPFRYKNLFNTKLLFLTIIPPLITLDTFKKPYKCWFFGLFNDIQRNKINNRIQTIQYNANSPIEDRISYKDLSSGEGYAALVLDGHGGWQIAEFVNKHLLDTFDSILNKNKEKYSNEETLVVESIKQAFDEVEQKILRFSRQAYKFGMPQIVKIGACALLVVVRNNKVYAANAGDSQGLLITQENGKYSFQKLNKKLNANSKKQKRRLQQLFPNQKDIVVCKKGEQSCYVKGRLQPTKSFGDVRLKFKQFNTLPVSQSIHAFQQGPYITHVPQIRVFNLQKKHKYIIMGCDGLWDQLSKGEVTAVVKRSIKNKNVTTQLLNQSLSRAAKQRNMTVESLKKVKPGKERRGMHDDISLIGISLQKQLN